MTKKKTEDKQIKRKTLRGVVVSAPQERTRTVLVKTFKQERRYGKYVLRSKRYLVHDAVNKTVIGDTVIIRECRPISKRKHFEVVS